MWTNLKWWGGHAALQSAEALKEGLEGGGVLLQVEDAASPGVTVNRLLMEMSTLVSTFNLCPDPSPLSAPRLGCPSHLAGILLFWRRWRALVLMTDEAPRSERIMGKKRSPGEMKNRSMWSSREETAVCCPSAVRRFTTSERRRFDLELQKHQKHKQRRENSCKISFKHLQRS